MSVKQGQIFVNDTTGDHCMVSIVGHMRVGNNWKESVTVLDNDQWLTWDIEEFNNNYSPSVEAAVFSTLEDLRSNSKSSQERAERIKNLTEALYEMKRGEE